MQSVHELALFALTTLTPYCFHYEKNVKWSTPITKWCMWNAERTIQRKYIIAISYREPCVWVCLCLNHCIKHKFICMELLIILKYTIVGCSQYKTQKHSIELKICSYGYRQRKLIYIKKMQGKTKAKMLKKKQIKIKYSVWSYSSYMDYTLTLYGNMGIW